MTEREPNRASSPMRDEDDQLEAFFAAGRSETPVVSAVFLDRIADDAAAVQAERQPAARAAFGPAPVRRTVRTGWRARLGAVRAQLGGGLAMGGLALATLVGVWIGAQPPQLLLDVESRLLGEVIVIEFADASWAPEDI